MDGDRKGSILIWFIENYSYCWHHHGEALVSPRIPAEGLEGTAWHLHLYPRGNSGGFQGDIALLLGRSESDNGPAKVSVKFELSAVGATDFSGESKCTFVRGQRYGWSDFLKMGEVLMKRKADYLPQGVLTVRCKIWIGERWDLKVAPLCARTRIGVEKISFLHVVENFSSLRPNEKNTIEIRSPPKNECFTSSSVYFTHRSNREDEIIVEVKPSEIYHVLFQRKVSLLDGSGNVVGCGDIEHEWNFGIIDIQGMPLSLTRQNILSKQSEYLPEGKLSLLFECVFSVGVEFERIEGDKFELPMLPAEQENNQELCKGGNITIEKHSAYPSAMEDIKALYANQCLTDVQLKTETRSYPAHKLILCARSPVFKRMLTSDMKEKQNNCIRIDDLGDDVVQQLLFFLYSDTTENLDWEMAIGLYYSADKYEVGKLKELCSSFLLANLSPRNVGELLLLSDTHTDTRLKESVEGFILEHEKEVFCSEEWENLVHRNPFLVMKTMQLKYKK